MQRPKPEYSRAAVSQSRRNWNRSLIYGRRGIVNECTIAYTAKHPLDPWAARSISLRFIFILQRTRLVSFSRALVMGDRLRVREDLGLWTILRLFDQSLPYVNHRYAYPRLVNSSSRWSEGQCPISHVLATIGQGRTGRRGWTVFLHGGTQGLFSSPFQLG